MAKADLSDSTLTESLDLHAAELGLTSELKGASRGLILVVEGDPSRTVARTLEESGFAVQFTNDGLRAARELAAGSRVDAVITDVTLQGLSGLDLLRQARERDDDLPILLMTDAPDVETAAQAVEHGAFQYLLKPIATDRLVTAMDKAVRARKSARAKTDALRMLEDLETVEMEMDNLPDRGRWDSALEKLWMAYQPIVLPTGKLYAYEALVRSDEPSMRGPGDLLDMAESLGELRELGRAIRARAGQFAVQASGRHYLFVNLHADDLLDELLTSREEPLSLVAPAVVLEITERAALHDVEEAKVKMAELRSMGFRIALDDLGAGYAGLTSFTQLRPDVVKLDMALVRGVDTDPVKRKLIKSVNEVSRDIGSTVVGEGVETAAERDTLIELGCNLLQGYLFGKPTRL
ncbi:MAG: EAL domain-containing protein [Polyangiaceae bacterium]